MKNPVHIIAEAGTNHNANPETAKKLVSVAKESGADSVKFQIIYPEGLYLSEFFENGKYTPNEVFEMRRAGMLTDKQWEEVSAFSQDAGIPFTASVFDQRGIDFLDKLDAPYLKIASCDLNNYPLIEAAAERNRPLVLSTGMSQLWEVEKAVEAATKKSTAPVILLHCVSRYPCPPDQTQLTFIKVLKESFGVQVGFSDHTESNIAAVAAVAMGATWLEKHFTLDRKSKGFDHAYAMEPDGLASYVADVRAISEAVSPHFPKVHQDESTVKQRARRSLYAKRNIEAGETLTADDVLIVRPEGAFVPDDLQRLTGRKVTRAISRFEPLNGDMFEG